ncbi:MAG: hypothetical protein NT144_07605 [Bacteroidia bacterium]|nr:hypothetical protein [Bacteroidia bacterium]
MNIIQRIWQKVSPDFLLVFVRFILEPRSYKKRRKAVLAHFKNFDQDTLVPEIREGLKYLISHKFSSFPYKWTQKYDSLLPKVFRDEGNQCFYTLFDSKKMYFPKRFTLTHVIWAVRAIMKEQDPLSPHLYLTSDFQVEPGSIVIDAGVAEGNFALSVVDKAKRLYLIECDIGWMESLRLTFAPWKEKVVFVEKYMSEGQSDTTTSIDELVSPESSENYFIKLDIEGYEQKALSGMKRLVASGNPVKMDVCTYHHLNDLNDIEAILQSYGFTYHVSDGYVLYFQMGEVPSFRRALIRAEKK